MLKKIRLGLVAVLAFGAAFASAQVAAVYVDGAQVEFADAEPIIRQDRVLVPLRAVLERLGAAVVWDPTRAEIRVTQGHLVTRLALGSREAFVNQDTRMMDTAPIMFQNRVMIPLRYLSELYGAKVHWDAARRAVYVYPGATPQP
jgi:hypothetical protein